MMTRHLRHAGVALLLAAVLPGAFPRLKGQAAKGATGDPRPAVRPSALQEPGGAAQGVPAEVALPEEPPSALAGQLTKEDPPDGVRRGSRHKVHEVRLEKGKAYVINLRSAGFLPFLRLEDANGTVVTAADSRGLPEARLLFEPRASGLYRLIAVSDKGGEGRYELVIERFAAGAGMRAR